MITSGRHTDKQPRIVAAWFGILLSALAMPALAETQSADQDWGPITIMGRVVEPATSRRFAALEQTGFRAWYLNSPVYVAHGHAPGPTLCLTAGIHGDELNGVEVARRSFAQTDPQQLRGTLISMLAINAEGVRSGNRYMTDRRDLNRAFPGKEGGSIASMVAYAVSSEILIHCDYVVDLHTGSDERANVPQIRADLDNQAVRELALHFGRGIIVGGSGPEGSWRKTAVDAGVPAIIYEAGGPLRFEQDEIDHGVEGVSNVMAYLGMIDGPQHTVPEDQVYTRSRWLRASQEQNGFFFPVAELGDEVVKGQLLGRIIDPATDIEHEIFSPSDGKLIGRSVSKPVLGGYGLFNLAWTE